LQADFSYPDLPPVTTVYSKFWQECGKIFQALNALSFWGSGDWRPRFGNIDHEIIYELSHSRRNLSSL